MKKLSIEEAIAILNDMKIDIPVPKAAVIQRKRNVALDMAIEALSSSEIPNSSDTISRAKAIEAVMECYDNDELFEVYEDKLRELPPAQPERIKGHWIVKHGSDAPPICDKCGYESRTTIKKVVDQNLKMIYSTGIDIKSNFCPNCGADMRGEQDG